MKNLNCTTRRQAGFTLIELMIAVAIVGILTALAAGAYGAFKNKAVASEAMTMVPAAFKAYEVAYINSSTVPLNNLQAGMPNPNDHVGNYVGRIEASSSGVTVTYRSDIGITGLDGTKLEFTPHANALNQIIWGCAGSSGPPTDELGVDLPLATGASVGASTSTPDQFRPAICL